ncbi:MAG: putative glycoside hydrolase [Campylobacterota bacterium]|nr:putative glycoside hydrolase [Campylobacterota bacterium]
MKYLLLLLPVLINASIIGQIFDKLTNEPIPFAKVSDNTKDVIADINGSFSINSKDNILHVKAYGYRPYEINSSDFTNTKVELSPLKIKAAYVSLGGARKSSKTFARVMKLVDAGEINALAIDIKDVRGWTSYKNSIDKKRYKGGSIKNIASYVKMLKEKNIYLIARVVVFKDTYQANKTPNIALKTNDGKVWKNSQKLAWLNPYNSKSHKYAIDIAKEVASYGFDEINFDYIRFPTKRSLNWQQKNNMKNRVATINKFLKKAVKELRPYGVFISVDTFGQISWVKNDQGLGQRTEELSKYADYISPMLYPSGFSKGMFKNRYPTNHNYEVIKTSLKKMKKDIDMVRVRPWLQAFKDYAHNKKHYTQKELNAQIKACDDMGTSGWILWNPSSKYIKVFPHVYR